MVFYWGEEGRRGDLLSPGLVVRGGRRGEEFPALPGEAVTCLSHF